MLDSSGPGLEHCSHKQFPAMPRPSGYVLAGRVGIPLVGFLCAGMYLMSTFMTTAFETGERSLGKASKSTRKFNMEEEYKNMMKSLDIDNYKLSRIPRPDDDKNTKSSQANNATISEIANKALKDKPKS